MEAIRPEDELFHDPGTDPHWNESAWFSLSVPDRLIHGGIHWNHRPNMNFTWTGIILWDPSGENVYDCLYFDWGEFQPLDVSSGAQMYDFSTPNGLTVKCVEPLQEYSIRYARHSCELDLTWRAFMDVINLGYPKGSEGWGHGHYQQAGRLTGTLRIDDLELAVDCGSNRDRSWGARNFNKSWDSFPRHDFPWFNDGASIALNIYSIPEKPPADDPVLGETDRVLYGWFLRDGLVGKIVSGTRRAVERRADGMASVVALDGIDEHGRPVQAEGRALTFIKRPAPPGLLGFCSFVEWTLDSGETIYGQTGEIFPMEFARRFLRSLPDRQATHGGAG